MDCGLNPETVKSGSTSEQKGGDCEANFILGGLRPTPQPTSVARLNFSMSGKTLFPFTEQLKAVKVGDALKAFFD